MTDFQGRVFGNDFQGKRSFINTSISFTTAFLLWWRALHVGWECLKLTSDKDQLELFITGCFRICLCIICAGLGARCFTDTGDVCELAALGMKAKQETSCTKTNYAHTTQCIRKLSQSLKCNTCQVIK